MLSILGNNLNSQTKPKWIESAIQKVKSELISKHGNGIKDKLERGLAQVSNFWWEQDGNENVFLEFVLNNFAADDKSHNDMFNRFEYLLEKIYGYNIEINREFRQQSDLDIGTLYPFDETFAGYDPAAHINTDFFNNKLAFTVLLNFPLTTLEQRIKDGKNWTRQQWAETRLAHKFAKRIPAEVNLEISKAFSESDVYIADYNVFMHHVLDENGDRLFPKKLKLLSHWNLRDELKSNYANMKEGLRKQKILQKVMERIVDQTIPKMVINNPMVDWNPFTNEVKKTTSIDFEEPIPENYKVNNDQEKNIRYQKLLNIFLAQRLLDQYSPQEPSLIDRQFNEARELPEERVKAMLESICNSPLRFDIAKIIEKRLNRKLEPFDIWYNGFKGSSSQSEESLDKITKAKYPNAKAFEKDIKNILTKFRFNKDMVKFISENIKVEPARGSGHAWGPGLKEGYAYLRTRVEKDGMNYKGYNIAVHELGHNVEQVLTLKNIDHTILYGVPNTAFTEAFAFVFQAHDKDLLGLKTESKNVEALKAINDFWMTYEIAGVALVDMEIWHWMYDHPKATADELKEATLEISKKIWNKFYGDVFNKKDVTILGIYSHIIHSGLYLPDYPIGHIIAFQIEGQMKKAGNIGLEFVRMCKSGNISPDFWMMNATGKPVGTEELINATKEALTIIKE